MNVTDRLRVALADRYTIECEIGAGGMATVFRAEDVRHRRRVAIKVLREDLAESVGAVRFLREIEIAARLQHPHILPLLDSGDADGLLFYVMPFVDGESLRQRLAREGELPIHDAVRILVEVVDALTYAHSIGVVHRDIKPDNIMLTARHAVVTDFGIAKAVSEATEGSTGGVTSLGVALGTPAYMSPEQAAADPHVDHRADIYAVGVVAYELIAGRPPFTGRSPQQLLAAQVTETPDPLSRHRPGVPPQLEDAVMRCLAKRAADRWQRAEDLLAVIEPLATPSGGTAPTSARIPATTAGGAAPPTKAWRRWALLAIPFGIVVALGAAWSMTRNRATPLVVGKSQQLTNDPELEIQPALSPDGKFVAYAGGRSNRMRVFIRPVSGGRTIPLSDDTTALEHQPQWSPDGQRLLFLVGGGASVAPALGGEARAAIPASPAGPVASATWSPDGMEIAFVRGDSLYRVPVSGGAARFVASAFELHSCAWSPSGKWIACVSLNANAVSPGSTFGNRAPSAIMLFPASGGGGSTIAPAKEMNVSPAWSPDSRSLFFLSSRDGPRDVYSVVISSSGQQAGAPVRLTTGLNASSISLSADAGRMTYAVFSVRANVWSLPIGTGSPGGIETATALTKGNQTIEAMSVSPDGKWLLYDSDIRGNSDIFRIPVAGGQPEQLTSEPWDEFAPDLSPDGRTVTYHSFRTGSRDIEAKPLDGGDVEHVTNSPAQESYPRWSHDGLSIAFFNQASPREVYVTRRMARGKWSQPSSLGPGAGAQWTPDGGTIIAATSTRNSMASREAQSGWKGWSILAMPARGGGARPIYTPPAGSPTFVSPRLARDGNMIYLKSHDAQGRTSFWELRVTGGQPRLVARLSDLTRPSSRADFSIGGKRLFFTLDERQSDVFVADVVRR